MADDKPKEYLSEAFRALTSKIFALHDREQNRILAKAEEYRKHGDVDYNSALCLALINEVVALRFDNQDLHRRLDELEGKLHGHRTLAMQNKPQPPPEGWSYKPPIVWGVTMPLVDPHGLGKLEHVELQAGDRILAAHHINACVYKVQLGPWTKEPDVIEFGAAWYATAHPSNSREQVWVCDINGAIHSIQVFTSV